jgi:phage recombination protein Bet
VKLSAGIIRSLIASPTKSGAQPSDRDCVKFMALCKSRALNPFEGDAFLLGYDGKDGAQFSLITAHQAFLKRAESSPEFDGIESGIVVRLSGKDGSVVERVGDLRYDGETLLGGWATVFFKNKSRPMKKILDVRKFSKPFGVWQSNPEGMIAKCAEADALRSSFPNKLGGCYLREEMEPQTVTPPKRALIVAPETAEQEPEITVAEVKQESAAQETSASQTAPTDELL